MHHIEAIDLALGTVERHETEPQSWHALETVRNGLSTGNCGLRAMEVLAAPVQVVKPDGAPYATPLAVPCVAHPLEAEKLHFLGRPFDTSYRLFTNAEFLDFAKQCFDAAGMDDSLAFTTTLYEGSRVTIAKRLPEADFKDAGGYEIRGYFNLFNSFDGSWAVFANVSEIRTVCANTATMNLGQGGYSKKHTPEGLAEFIANFPQLLADALTTHKGSANDYLVMASHPMTNRQAQAFFVALLAKGEKLSTVAYNRAIEGLAPLFTRGKGVKGISRADAYCAVTEYFTHNASAESNAPEGSADNYKREARQLLLSDKLDEMLVKGEKLMVDYLARK